MAYPIRIVREQETRNEIKVKNEITVELFNREGTLLKTVSADRITTVGIDGICDRVGRSTPGTAFGSGYQYLMVGTSAAAPAAGNTNLGVPISGKLFGSRLQGSFTHPAGSNYFSVARTFGVGTCTGNWYESGLFIYQRIAAAGKMLNRGTFALVAKAASDSARITHKVTFTV